MGAFFVTSDIITFVMQVREQFTPMVIALIPNVFGIYRWQVAACKLHLDWQTWEVYYFSLLLLSSCQLYDNFFLIARFRFLGFASSTQHRSKARLNRNSQILVKISTEWFLNRIVFHMDCFPVYLWNQWACWRLSWETLQRWIFYLSWLSLTISYTSRTTSYL